MEQIDASNAVPYLRARGRLGKDEPARATELSGGISNCVLYISRPTKSGGDFVLKQARGQLRTPDPWFCTVERIWREAAVLRWCSRFAPGDVPLVLYEDRDDYWFAMTAAPQPFETWKAELMRQEVRTERAVRAGRMLGNIHAGTWNHAQAQSELADQTLFQQLRLDPYYRSVAATCPDMAPDFEALIDLLARHRRCLVHADFAPKNLLVSGAAMMLVDFETGHFGDPAFDLGFFLTHLTLKAFHFAPQHEPILQLTEMFWREYEAAVSAAASDDERRDLEARGNLNFAGCAWARLDGTSKVDYLDDPRRRESVRELCQWIFREQPAKWIDVLARARRSIEGIASR